VDQQLARHIQPGLLAYFTVIESAKTNVVAAGVIFLALDTGRCLLQLRNSEKRFRHTWGFFGGMLESGETPFQALQRELIEEIGFMPELAKLNPLDIYQSRDERFRYYSFVAVVDQEFSPTLNAESAGYAWVNVGNWPQPLHQGARVTLSKNQGTHKLHTILEHHRNLTQRK